MLAVANMILIILVINGYQISWWLIFSLEAANLLLMLFMYRIMAIQQKKNEALKKANEFIIEQATHMTEIFTEFITNSKEEIDDRK